MLPKAKPLELSADFTLLRDRVRDELRRRIIDGVYPPGQRIVERELAVELGVSRIPIRESFRMLESEGFVSVVPRRGVIVRSLTERDVLQLFDVREALEVLACRRGAENATKADLARLRRIIVRADKAAEAGDLHGVGLANEVFHDELIRIAKNDLLANLLEPLQGRLHWLFRQHSDPVDLVRQHDQLLDAIGSGDPDRAAVCALAHVQANRDLAIHLLFHQSESASSPGASTA